MSVSHLPMNHSGILSGFIAGLKMSSPQNVYGEAEMQLLLLVPLVQPGGSGRSGSSQLFDCSLLLPEAAGHRKAEMGCQTDRRPLKSEVKR